MFQDIYISIVVPPKMCIESSSSMAQYMFSSNLELTMVEVIVGNCELTKFRHPCILYRLARKSDISKYSLLIGL